MQNNFYQSIIEIKKVPDIKNKQLEDVSWLSDPFGDARVYCTVFSLQGDRFSWRFLLKESSKLQALESGHRMFNYLRELYPGLTGLSRPPL